MISAARRRQTLGLGFAAGLLLLSGAHEARAENPGAAEALFAQGKALSAQNKWAEACPKFEESQRLDPGMGTLFQLANCHQRISKTATAWAEFLQVAAEAKTAGQTAREKVARERAAELESKLSKLTITVDASATPGLSVLRDGTQIGRGQWSTALPVDPGTHRVEASAPGKKPWSNVVHLGEALSLVVRVPALTDAPAAMASAAPVPASPAGSAPATTTATTVAVGNEFAPTPLSDPPSEDTRDGSGQRIAGGITLGAGVVGLGVGTVFGLLSKGARDDSDAHCREGDRCDATGVSLRDEARSHGTISTVAFGVGAAAVVTGAVLWFTAPSSKSVAVGIAPTLQGASLRGSF